jgi:hypothetical protein
MMVNPHRQLPTFFSMNPRSGNFCNIAFASPDKVAEALLSVDSDKPTVAAPFIDACGDCKTDVLGIAASLLSRPKNKRRRL